MLTKAPDVKFNTSLNEFLWMESTFKNINRDISVMIDKDYNYTLKIPNSITEMQNELIHKTMKDIVSSSMVDKIYYIENDMRFVINECCV